MAAFPTREQFLESCQSQKFSLPMPIMKYIWSNPSTPAAYQLLIQCCKFFFIKNSIQLCRNLAYTYSGQWENCTKNECDDSSCENNHERIDLNNLHIKMWLSNEMSLYGHFDSNITPKIYRYNVKVLELDHLYILYDDLKMLSAGVQECSLLCIRDFPEIT